MDFTIKSAANWHTHACDCLIIPVFEKNRLAETLKGLDKDTLQWLERLSKNGDIPASIGSTTILHTHAPLGAKRLLMLGCGKTLGLAELGRVLTACFSSLSKLPVSQVALLGDLLPMEKSVTSTQMLQQIACILTAQSYRYDTTLSKKADKLKLKKITLLFESAKAAEKKALQQGQAIGIGMNTAKMLGDLPPNICTPGYLAKHATQIAKGRDKLSVKVLDEAQMKKLKMGALLSVTAGTVEPAKTIIMEYKGSKKADAKPYVLIGKGVTFDSGGISIKPGAKMDEMKYDMCGAASVIGTLQTVSELDLPINVIGIVGAVENLPSGTATKPGDVITSMSGQTIEVLNTDAEGRMVLCDLLTYAERFKPAAVIDIATLTGACVVALGRHASAVYSNHQPLTEQLQQAGTTCHDRVWPMPLWEEYDKQLKSNFADMANIGGPEAGSVTAACFLSRFSKKYHWAHLDIAGTAWSSGGSKGATGRPVSLLSQYLIDRC